MWQADLVFYLVMFVILVISAVLAVLVHAGYFHTVRIRMAAPHVQPRHFAYVVKTGPYKNCAGTFSSLAKLAPKKILFGVYYDDPDVVSLNNETHGATERIIKFLDFSICIVGKATMQF